MAKRAIVIQATRVVQYISYRRNVRPKFKDKFEYNNLMCAPGIVAHTSQQITNVSSQVSYITLLQHKYIKVCDKRK